MCKATSAVSNETDRKCCFSNLLVFVCCMCFPGGVGGRTLDDATHSDSVKCVCVCVRMKERGGGRRRRGRECDATAVAD